MLQDQQGREFRYLRLSVTDICNFRCNYCLPDGNQDCHSLESHLSLEEISSLVATFARLGTQKIRITGGEPSIRRDLTDIIRICKQTPGIQSVALTTNGYKLPKFVQSWVDAGLDRLNISVDSLDPRMFQSITGHDRLEEILQGIDLALQSGLEKVKINSVLMREYNLGEFSQLVHWVKNKSVTLRFIELMQTGDNEKFFRRNHVSGEELKQFLLQDNWIPVARSKTAGPAIEYMHPDFAGRIGLIMPYSKDFCKSCNRLRVSSQGKLHLCLFGEEGFSLRHWCRPEAQELLQQKIYEFVTLKKDSHFLHAGKTGATRHLAMLGG
ncbi:GTP 3',8-cyclase MoaA [Pleionea sp. CnH1-48]|uniref:GTP 3',8-cyclase MoaA n=1 Tax=Pleionea sp. CnH1-48 TaxID=2954494 RepID=UPI002097D1A2|nr:GTP 3',8-cyclase MoaA [Pleionea sp. CnH1-48]MCO7225646.1 GTP 3',8-cyclase MoaA [Pleionea sp. CnH1-48]